ncbi:MAG TPA: dUTP diphosphatase [bacterium]|nr:dUTP diphosphatase [bacterium]
MEQPTLQIEVLPGQEDLGLPTYATQGAAGLDLKAALGAPLVLKPGERGVVPTGLKMAIPLGFEGCVRPRSGLAMKQGLTLTNAPGTIDSDYRGEVKVLVINLGQEPVTLKRGDRIAQLLISPVAQARVVKVEKVDDTQRGVGGFGHTGIQ